MNQIKYVVELQGGGVVEGVLYERLREIVIEQKGKLYSISPEGQRLLIMEIA